MGFYLSVITNFNGHLKTTVLYKIPNNNINCIVDETVEPVPVMRLLRPSDKTANRESRIMYTDTNTCGLGIGGGGVPVWFFSRFLFCRATKLNGWLVICSTTQMMLRVCCSVYCAVADYDIVPGWCGPLSLLCIKFAWWLYPWLCLFSGCIGSVHHHQWPLLLTWFNFNPSMDK